MKLKKIATLGLAAALLLGVALALPAVAQRLHSGHGHGHGMGPMGPGMEGIEEFLTKALDLNAEQQAAAKALHQELRTKAEPLLQQHHQQMDEVKALLDGDSPDPAEVGQKVIAAHATHKQLGALHEEVFARFSKLLNADQLAKLQELHESHHGEPPFGPLGHGF